MKLITFDELRNKLGGRARSSIYLDLEHARLPIPLKLGGRLYWEEDQINKWIKERLRLGQDHDCTLQDYRCSGTARSENS